MTRKYTLKKHERLKSQKQLDKLFSGSQSRFKYPLKLIYLLEESDEGEWPMLFSISVPKKKVKSAVKRNLIKRRVRESYRLNKNALQEHIFTLGNIKLSMMFIFIENHPIDFKKIDHSVKALLLHLTNEINS